MIAAVAERQYGLIDRDQLREVGVSDTTIDRLVARGWLRRVAPGVFAVGHRRLDQRGRFMAAVLAGGPDAALSHMAAAALWDLTKAAAKPEVSSATGRAGGHRAALAPDERTTRLGIPVTTVERTVIDIAATQPKRVERLVRQADALGRLNWNKLGELLDRYPRKRGSKKLRALVADTRPVIRSELEDRFRALLLDADLPTPVHNATLELNATAIEVDCWWPEQRLVVELDGHTYHANCIAFERDRERDRRLQAAGIKVIRVTWRQLRGEPSAVAKDLRTLLLS